jgi:sugar phosphate isomerase/epimerase
MAAPGSLSLNTITVKSLNLAQAVEACARHGIPAISPWRDIVQAAGVANAAKAIRDAGLAVSGLCRGGMFPASDVAGRAAAIEDNRRAIAEAHAVGAACLVMVVGGLPAGSRDLPGARAMVRDGIAAILDDAKAAGVTLALEPLHPMTCADRSVLSTIDQALDLCDEFGDGVGVAIDCYHVWWDPKLDSAIARAGQRIKAFHFCDIGGIWTKVRAAGYEGAAECEILSKRWWQEDPGEVLRIMCERHATVLSNRHDDKLSRSTASPIGRGRAARGPGEG